MNPYLVIFGFVVLLAVIAWWINWSERRDVRAAIQETNAQLGYQDDFNPFAYRRRERPPPHAPKSYVLLRPDEGLEVTHIPPGPIRPVPIERGEV